MTPKQRLIDQITDLCEQAGCSPQIAKIHLRQYAHGNWNPHPPLKFVSWWNKNGALQTELATDKAWFGIDAVRAFNCEAVRVVYRASSGTQPSDDHPCKKDLGALILT